MFAIYAAGIGAVAIGITPAGIGIVEAALAAAITTGGISSSQALPAVLVYRAISCRLVLAVGWFIFVRSRRHIADHHMHTEYCAPIAPMNCPALYRRVRAHTSPSTHTIRDRTYQARCSGDSKHA
jgi:hypothetical protein